MSPTNFPPPQGSWALAAPDNFCVQDQDLSQPPHAALQLINGLRAATGREQMPQGWGLHRPGP